MKSLLNKTKNEVSQLNGLEANDFVSISNGVVNWKGNFKRFFLKNNMPEKILMLKNNLDKKSCEKIDLYLDRMLYMPDVDLVDQIKFSRSYLDSLYTPEERDLKNQFLKEIDDYKNFFYLPSFYSPDVFLFHHGLRFAPDKVKNYVRNKDFIDGGAWVGDGAIVLHKYYNPRKIYAFELSPKNCEEFLLVMDANRIPKDKYLIIPCGLSDKQESVFFADENGPATSVFNTGNTQGMLTDLDSFIQKEKNITVGFIKTDLEGYGLKALKGMAETIRIHRPILSLSIYHSTEEFFEMKPLLEQIVKDKNYKITINQYEVYIQNLTEISLFAYPIELDS